MTETETEWLTFSKVTIPVMNALRRKGSDRKFYLAAAAVVRNIEPLLDDPCRKVIQVVERFADGLATHEEMDRVHEAADAAATDWWAETQGRTRNDQVRIAANYAACYAAQTQIGGWGAAVNAMERVTKTGKRKDIWAWQAAMLRDIFGNPFRPPPTLDPAWLRWRDGTISRLAQQMYDSRDFASMPILADALEEAGCTSGEILEHCRGPGPHVRGCWVVDLLLGKE